MHLTEDGILAGRLRSGRSDFACKGRINPSRWDCGMVVLYSLASFAAALLLFTLEPMIGKRVLPYWGGTPAVWNVCLVFFQAALLGGYALADQAAAAARKGRGTRAFAVLAALAVWGVLSRPLPSPGTDAASLATAKSPALALLGVLAMASLAPMLVVSSVSPLLQAWFARTNHRRASDPYFLYAASNLGSLLALAAYPLVIEPRLGLAAQEHLWRAGFVLTMLLVLAAGIAALRTRPAPVFTDPRAEPTSRPGAQELLERFLLVFIPSVWLPALTAALTTDIAAIPLLWMIPLGIYLAAFIIAFAWPEGRAVRLAARVLPALAASWALVTAAGFTHLVWIPLHLLLFLAGTLACLGRLVRGRPPAHAATSFYLGLAAAGLCGSVFTALLAPLVFTRMIEYPAAVVLACGIGLATGAERFTGPRAIARALFPGLVVFAVTAILVTDPAGAASAFPGVLLAMLGCGVGFLACWRASRAPVRFALVLVGLLCASGLTQGPSGPLLAIDRGFFGLVRVTRDDKATVHRLFLGSTLHGEQALDPMRKREPLTYFTRSGPIGDVMRTLEPAHPGADPPRIAVVGLGAGTLAAYGRAGEDWDFYEIDPAVIHIAQDPQFFTYLSDCASHWRIIPGDARLEIEREAQGEYALIVLDAFSSDATPVHLLTREAIQLYLSRLAPGGLLAFNATNRYLALDQVLARQAEDAGLSFRVRDDVSVSAEERAQGKQPSIWCVMARGEQALGSIATSPLWRKFPLSSNAPAWTDEFSDLASVVILRPWIRPPQR